MAVDMKEMMADAVSVLLFEKNKKKITVKDIVEECSITRQAFYYHFADIPELIRWMMNQKAEEILKESGKLNTPEDLIRYWLLIGINSRSRMKKSLDSNYGKEIEQIVFDEMVNLFTELVNQRPGAEKISEVEKRLVIRYHCHAFSGIIRDWTDEDSGNLDRIVHDIYLIVSGKRGEIFPCEEI